MNTLLRRLSRHWGGCAWNTYILCRVVSRTPLLVFCLIKVISSRLIEREKLVAMVMNPMQLQKLIQAFSAV